MTTYVAKYMAATYGDETVTLTYTTQSTDKTIVYNFTSIAVKVVNQVYNASKNFTVSFNGVSLYSTGSVNVKTSKTFSINVRVTINKDANSKSATLNIYWPQHDTKVNSSGWATSSGTSLSETYKVNFTIPARERYYIRYNTDGGTAISEQSQLKGDSIAITSSIPTKEGYLFRYWNDSNGNIYNPGNMYTGNATISLTAKYYKYAAFESSGTPIVAYRCNYSTPNVVEDEGTSCVINYTVAYDYAMKTDKDTTVEIRAIAYAPNIDEPFYTGPYVTIVQEAPSGSGNINYASATYLLGDSSTVYDTDSHYDIVLEARTSFDGESYTDTRYLRLDEAFFTMDIASGGHCIGFGGPAYSDYGNDPNIKGWILNYFKVAFFDDVMFKFMAGVIQMYGGEATQSVNSNGIVTVTGAPSGWLICDGSAVSRTAYAELFNAISTKWGSGNGSTTFNLPDLRGRAPIGAGTGSGLTARSLGGKIGSEKLQSHTHTLSSHTHTLSHTHKLTSDAKQAWLAKAGTGATEPGGSISSSGKYYAAANATGFAWIDTTAGASTSTTTGPSNNSSGSTGDGNAQNMQPSAVVNFIICTGKTV